MQRLARRLVLLGIAYLSAWACGSDSSSGPGSRADETPPARPTQLRITRIGDGEVWLSWNAVPDEPREQLRYTIYRAAADSTPVSVNTTVQTEFRDVGLVYQTEYSYFVTAVDAAGNQSFPSNTVSGQPFNNLGPLAPTGLRAFAHNLFILSQLDIVLDWTANTESDLSSYRVYRSVLSTFTPDSTTLRAEVDTPWFEDEQVEVGTTYYYRVTAVDRGGKESQPSDEVSDIPLAQPQLDAPVRGELASATPTFRWRPVAGARRYQVVVTTSPTSGEVSAMPLTAQTTATFAARVERDGKPVSLASGSIYYWKVIASTRDDGLENSVSQVERFKVR